MTPLALSVTLILALMFFVLPRKWAIAPILICACDMTTGPGIIIGPANLPLLRILILCGVIRVLIRHENILKRNKIDNVFILWAVLTVVTGTLLDKNFAGFVNRSGKAFDAFGIYFLFRWLIRDHTDIVFVLKLLAVLLVPLSMEMISEKITGRNYYSIFGGVAESVLVRHGKMRCQGPFMHPILTGTVGGTSLGLLSILWLWDKSTKKFAYFGTLACLIIVIMSASSGPIMSVFLFVLGMVFWFLRKKMKMVRWGVVIGLIIIQISMNAPIWYLLARIDLTGSSTGFHRSLLISSTFQHFNEWWLLGTNRTIHWMPTGVDWSDQHTDITNHFIKQAVLGGLSLMLAFIYLIIRSFKDVGNAMWNSIDKPIREQLLIWTLGSVLFSHVITFLSISYFDQSILFFFLNIALIATTFDISSNKDEVIE